MCRSSSNDLPNSSNCPLKIRREVWQFTMKADLILISKGDSLENLWFRKISFLETFLGRCCEPLRGLMHRPKNMIICQNVSFEGQTEIMCTCSNLVWVQIYHCCSCANSTQKNVSQQCLDHATFWEQKLANCLILYCTVQYRIKPLEVTKSYVTLK